MPESVRGEIQISTDAKASEVEKRARERVTKLELEVFVTREKVEEVNIATQRKINQYEAKIDRLAKENAKLKDEFKVMSNLRSDIEK